MPCRQIISIGRRPGSGYQISSNTVSSDHALLVVGDSNRHLLIDHESVNGTRVGGVDGGERIRQKMVNGHEEVFFGDVQCQVNDILYRAGIQE